MRRDKKPNPWNCKTTVMPQPDGSLQVVAETTNHSNPYIWLRTSPGRDARVLVRVDPTETLEGRVAAAVSYVQRVLSRALATEGWDAIFVGSVGWQ